jgi:hypothetical protein
LHFVNCSASASGDLLDQLLCFLISCLAFCQLFYFPHKPLFFFNSCSASLSAVLLYVSCSISASVAFLLDQLLCFLIAAVLLFVSCPTPAAAALLLHQLCFLIGCLLFISCSISPSSSSALLPDRLFAFCQLSLFRISFCAADFSLLNLPKGKSLVRSKPATNS